MTKSPPRSAAALVFFLFVSQAAAAEPEDAVVITATRTPTRASQLVGDVSVIRSEEIERAGASSLVELLQRQPGVEVSRNGGLGANSSVFLRGTNADHVLVLVDGLRVGSATLGQTAFQNIPPSQIERIEIVRGPMSSLYGSEAIGGVIQIFTRAGEGPVRPLASAGYGTYDTEQYTAGVGGSIEEATTFQVDVGYLSTRGFSAIEDPAAFSFNPDRDGHRNKSATARLAHRLAAGHELGGTLFWSESRTDFYGFPADFDHYQEQTLAAYGLYSRNRFLPSWQSTVRIGQGTDDLSAFSAAQPDVFKTVQDQLSWQNEIETRLGDVLLAAEYLEQRVSGTTSFPVQKRTTDSLLAGYTGRWGAHTLQTNLRLDDNSQFGGETTGALGYAFGFAPGWRLSASYGTAFKAPNFNELYFPPAFGCPAFGNPDLRPESSKNLEAAVRYQRAAHSAGVVAYRNRIDDLIVAAAIPGNPFCFRAENVDEAEITGVTLTYGFARAGWTFRANADFQNPEDRRTGRELPRRAREHGAALLAREWRAASAGVEVVASGKRFDDTANTQRLEEYVLFNLFGEYRFGGGWSVFGRVDNLFDEHYQLAHGFAQPGASVFAGVRYAAK
jgi:vitamin B12 transporter